MPELQTAPTTRLGTSVGTVKPIPIADLCRLLREYVERLNQKTGVVVTFSVSRVDGEQTRDEVLNDVRYLASQTIRLINKGSAYHEQGSLSETEKFELELYLFDAEDALRAANRVLRRHGITVPV